MCRVSSVLYIPIYSYIWKTVLYIPIYSYIWKTVLYIPIYSYIWKTVLYIPIFQGKQEMLNSYLKQMLLISNMDRCKLKSALILPHGKADVERSLQVNTSVVTEDRPHIGEAQVCVCNQNSQGCS